MFKNRDIKLNQQKGEYYKFFTKKLLTTEIRKIRTLMNKLVYLGQSILYLSKTVMFEFWYDYVKPK